MQINLIIYINDIKLLWTVLFVLSTAFVIDGIISHFALKNYKKVIGRLWIFYTVVNSFYLFTKCGLIFYIALNFKYKFGYYSNVLIISYLGFVLCFVKEFYCKYKREHWCILPAKILRIVFRLSVEYVLTIAVTKADGIVNCKIYFIKYPFLLFFNIGLLMIVVSIIN